MKPMGKLRRTESYVPITSLLLSIALSRIWEASKYLSSSERVLKRYRESVGEDIESTPYLQIYRKMEQKRSNMWWGNDGISYQYKSE